MTIASKDNSPENFGHELDSLCEKLDKFTIEYIECYQQIIENHELLDQCLNDGYLNMSKARSLVGCNSLSILQVPSEIDANVDVVIEDKIESDLKYSSYSLKNVNSNEYKVSPFPKWFGVLAPLSLKNSQKSFCKSLDIITNLCELQSKLKSIEKQYRSLMVKKVQLKSN